MVDICREFEYGVVRHGRYLSIEEVLATPLLENVFASAKEQAAVLKRNLDPATRTQCGSSYKVKLFFLILGTKLS